MIDLVTNVDAAASVDGSARAWFAATSRTDRTRSGHPPVRDLQAVTRGTSARPDDRGRRRAA
jgi:hypothetical protein